MNTKWQHEIESKNRFKFGKNWANFLTSISEEKVDFATKSLNQFLDISILKGKSFLDIGSGSGLSSLAALRSGAKKVFSFDYDEDSVKSTSFLKEKYQYGDDTWTVLQGSVLDTNFLNHLGQFDIVYSWGVLHHTGSMWEAIKNAIGTVSDDGYFMIAIYNDQGWKSKFWWYVKKVYNSLNEHLQKPFALVLGIFFNILNIIKYTLMLKPMAAIRPLLNYKVSRGMSVHHDIIDWMGGFPYEYSTVEKLNEFFKSNGFKVIKSLPATSLGCHQILYKKEL